MSFVSAGYDVASVRKLMQVSDFTRIQCVVIVLCIDSLHVGGAGIIALYFKHVNTCCEASPAEDDYMLCFTVGLHECIHEKQAGSDT